MRSRDGAMRALVLLLAGVFPGAALAQSDNPSAARVSAPSGRPDLLSDPTLPSAAAISPNRPTMLPDYSPPPAPESAALIVLNVEYKFMRPRRQGSDFAIADPNTDSTPQGAIRSLDGTPSSGFRASVGYHPGSSPWLISLGYTFFRANNSLTAISPAGGLLWATQTVPGLILTADNATATSRWNYDLYDLELGRDFAIDTALTLRVLGGVRLANIGLDSQVAYDGRDANLANVAAGFDFTGAGVMIGGETHWTFGPRLSVFGRGRGGMLFGANKAHFRETNNAGAIVDADVTQRTAQTVPFLEMALGAQWRFQRFVVRGGYDVANWFQLVSTPEFPDDISRGKLSQRQSNFSLDGIFVQLAYSF